MFCYKLKEDDKYDSRFVEGILIKKYEWYCNKKKNIKLENNILVDNNSFVGYTIPNELKLVKPIKETKVKKNVRKTTKDKKDEEK